MSGKTVWIINQYAGSPKYGMEYRHYYLAKELIAKGNRVVILSGSYSHLYKLQPEPGEGSFTKENIEGIDYWWVKVPRYKRSVSLGRIWNMLVFMFRLSNFPISELPSPDAILVSSPSLFPIIRGRKWARRFRCKLFFEIRDIWPLTLQHLGKLSSLHPLVWFLSRFERFGYRNADAVVALLPNTIEHIHNLGISPKKYSCIPNGIYLPEASGNEPLSTSVAERILPGGFKIGYAGTLGLSNAMDYFVEACKLLSENEQFHFYLVGNGGEKQRLVEQAKGLRNITFIESIPKTQVQSFLKEMDACYIGWRNDPLYRYGISANKIYDYMYSGKPVIHSVNAFNDPVKESGCGISAPAEDVAAIKDAMLRLCALPQQDRETMGRLGKAYVLEHYNYEAIADKYIELMSYGELS